MKYLLGCLLLCGCTGNEALFESSYKACVPMCENDGSHYSGYLHVTPDKLLCVCDHK